MNGPEQIYKSQMDFTTSPTFKLFSAINRWT